MMGKVVMSGIVPQMTVPSAGTPISEFTVGSTVKMNVNGVATDFLIVHQGLPSSLYDESCNGTWLLKKDIYESRQWHSSNKNTYSAATIHSYLNSTFLGLLDSDIQAVVKQVKIPYVNGTGSGGSVASGANGLSAKIFLLSGYEVGFTTSVNSYFPVDGAKLDYFESGDTFGGTNRAKRIAYLNSTATYWWLRSPHINNTDSAWFVNDIGGYGHLSCSGSYGIRPALVLPSTVLIKKDGSVVI